MKSTDPIDRLIAKYQKQLEDIINPDNASWKDLGFDEKPGEFSSPLEYLRAEGEFDEGDQVEMSLVDEILDDLKALKRKIKRG